MRILVIEDDPQVADFIVKGLQEENHIADTASEGNQGLLMAATENYDALVVDRMLPGLDGLSIVKTLRATGNKTPVLILSAMGEVDQRVEGLNAGGDDYLVKPFAFSELLARLEALLRRTQQESDTQSQLTVSDLTIDLLARKVTRAQKTIELQQREFRLLEYLMRHTGQVVSRTMLLEQVWDYHFDPQTNVVDVHISRLRQKIDKGFGTPLIHTIRGAGYRLGD
ncbi:MAG: response regulator transcription factor [Pseudomonadales bacterium]|nr:response regulator transcription factor [Pseudomonadales bacterium]